MKQHVKRKLAMALCFALLLGFAPQMSAVTALAEEGLDGTTDITDISNTNGTEGDSLTDITAASEGTLDSLTNTTTASGGALEYNLWVGETQITSGNADDVFGDGTVSYNADDNVLNLSDYVCSDGVTISGSATVTIQDSDGSGITLEPVEDKAYDITLLLPENETPELSVTEGSVTVTLLKRGDAVYCSDEITLEDWTVTKACFQTEFPGVKMTICAEDGSGTADCFAEYDGDKNIVTFQTPDGYGWVGDEVFALENNASGTGWSYDAETKTLTISDDIRVSNIDNMEVHGIEVRFVDVSTLTICGEGSPSIVATSGYGIYVGTGSLILTGALGDIEAYYSAIHGDWGVTIKGTVGNLTSSEDRGIYSPIDVTIAGTVGDIHAAMSGIHSKNVTITGVVGEIVGSDHHGITGEVTYEWDEETGEYLTVGGDVIISGDVGNISGGSTGITAGGTVTIESPVTVSTTNEGAEAIYSKKGIILSGTAISVPSNGKVKEITIDDGDGIFSKYTTIVDVKGNVASEVSIIAKTGTSSSGGSSSGGSSYYPNYPTATPRPTATPVPTEVPIPTEAPTATTAPTYSPETSWISEEIRNEYKEEEKKYDVLIGTSATDASMVRTMKVGETVDLNFYGVKNWTKDAYTAEWTTSDESIATVNEKGVVTMLTEGIVIVKLNLVKKDTGEVINVAPVIIGVPETSYDVFLGTSATDASLQRELEVGKQVDLNFYGVKNWKKDDYEYEWTSSDETVAVVDKVGVVTGLSAGKVVIRLKLKYKATGEYLTVAPVVLTVPEVVKE